MNNEPVAWICEHGVLSSFKTNAYCTPLYTHPAELTDEEIHQVFKEIWDATTNPNCVMTAFAKAILKKAQEK